MNSFAELKLIAPLQAAVRDAGYFTPTPIQAQSIPHLLAGRDLLGCARTGTGKTAAFALPILQRLAATTQRGTGHPPVRALVLVPTRELAAQVCESFRRYGAGLSLVSTVIYGGVGQGPQVSALRRGVDILVATPGRLVDLMGQGHLRLDRVEVLVLDEADHMLDLGFIPDVRKVLAVVPRKRQTLFFSATMPPPIAKLAATILSNPVEVVVTPIASTVELTEQSVHMVDKAAKSRVLAEILSDPKVESALVFTRTKRGADRVAKRLGQDGIRAEAIHGNKSQNVRERTLEAFRARRIRVLVATDIAARGIDVDGITHVVNYELPNVPESYVHRIGRTGRAGASGIAISLCDAEERPLLRDIEKLLKRELPKIGSLRGGHQRSEVEQAPRRHAPTRSAPAFKSRPATAARAVAHTPKPAIEAASRFGEGIEDGGPRREHPAAHRRSHAEPAQAPVADHHGRGGAGEHRGRVSSGVAPQRSPVP
ncbi:MAG TPA: DEAD/DEAH box helicase, partial [Planctomycetota bacterium]|nr:DEAD/DEAH box helicase [Planctomycetota bacterium]